MNDKDKEAFEKCRLEYINTHTGYFKMMRADDIAQVVWQAACQYKQKEIDELKDRHHHEVEMIDGAAEDHIQKLQSENAKLKECLKTCPILGEIHRDSNDRFKEWSLELKYVLKELEDK